MTGARRPSPARPARDTASLTDALCTRCGLCCNGTLFADVELAGRGELVRLEALGLEVEEPDGDDVGGLLIQPCAALAGTRCSIYARRPGCCRTFECRLLSDVRRGAVTLAAARTLVTGTRSTVARIERLIARLAPVERRLPLAERGAEALAATAGARDAETRRLRSVLGRALQSLERRIAVSFFGRAV
jgi:hypothetical protein